MRNEHDANLALAAARLNAALAHPDASWAYFRIMTTADKRDMDDLLVSQSHPLAFEPGTNLQRFNALHKAGFRFKGAA